MAEPNRLTDEVKAEHPDDTPRDRPISPRLPLFAGAGLVAAGVALFAAGGDSSQRLGLGVISLGAGIAMLNPLLYSVREILRLRSTDVWPFVPTWARAMMLVRPIGIGIGILMLLVFAVVSLFSFVAVELSRQGAAPVS